MAHLVEDDVAQYSGIVNQNVDAAESIERQLDDRFAVLWLDDGQRRRDRLAALLLDRLDGFLRRAGIVASAFKAGADIANHHVGALGGEQHGDAAADTAPRPGDDGNFTRNISRH